MKKYVTKEPVKINEVLHGTIYGSTTEGTFCLSTAVVGVTLEDGTEYWVSIYPKTKEVVSYQLIYQAKENTLR